jgi:hypothetical protein
MLPTVHDPIRLDGPTLATKRKGDHGNCRLRAVLRRLRSLESEMLRRPMLSPLHFARWSQPPDLHGDFCTPETQFPDNCRADAAG